VRATYAGRKWRIFIVNSKVIFDNGGGTLISKPEKDGG